MLAFTIYVRDLKSPLTLKPQLFICIKNAHKIYKSFIHIYTIFYIFTRIFAILKEMLKQRNLYKYKINKPKLHTNFKIVIVYIYIYI